MEGERGNGDGEGRVGGAVFPDNDNLHVIFYCGSH